jgi:hypothetical protein
MAFIFFKTNSHTYGRALQSANYGDAAQKFRRAGKTSAK